MNVIFLNRSCRWIFLSTLSLICENTAKKNYISMPPKLISAYQL